MDTILKRLTALHPKSIDLVLDRVVRLLGALDNPHQKLPPVVHVAGTNGKGSSIAFLRAFCEAAGLRVHVYTSPHLVHFNERIRVAGKLITDDALDAILTECEDANQGLPITFFEITTAAAFLAFSRTPADIVLLETGLGGRLDATNVIDRPRLTCITPVSLDHQHYLGNNVKTIMGEKAGILKSGVDCIAAKQGSKLLQKVLEKAASAARAPLLSEGKVWFSRVSGGRRETPAMIYTNGDKDRTFPMPRLVGQHQVRNASLAIACAEALAPDFEISDAAIALGLNTVQWPGRLQHITQGPLIDLLDDGFELWLDGGHNKAAAEMLAQHTRRWRKDDIWLVFGALNQRPAGEFFTPLQGKLAGLRTLTIPGQDNALTAEEGLAAAHELGIEGETSATVHGALQSIMDQARQQGRSGGRILICGSLTLVGHVLDINTL
ncbi:MAG: bifunctional folylpolyglutamate synthase/dihydrofolate synthase [Rhodospirillaceae bacterium]|nr:MAG: bifunctional folylpolyglutamate synthase/dihydrofolate synthase [Rhodospirillaceae bacterium]